MAIQEVPSALDSRTQAFPILTAAQIDSIRPSGQTRPVRTGDIVFEPGDTDVPFFVLLTGAMEIVQPGLDGEQMVATHGPGEFTGEITMISGARCLVRGRVTEAGEFLEVSGEALRSLVAKDAELGEIFLRAFILRRLELVARGYGNLILLGSRHSAQTLQLRQFLGRNGHPYTYVDLDTDKTSQELLDRFDVTPADVPVVICNTNGVLKNPSIHKLASCLGLNSNVNGTQVLDVVIVGAGPAGLAAGVYAASEGLDVLILEERAPGGQAGASSKIENYLGFPTGISGQELAGRATTQARKFGAKMMIASTAVRLNCDHRPYEIVLEEGDPLLTRSIVIASGAQYNKPPITDLERLEGKGIYYGATYIESQLCESDDVAIIGGGNSAGQAAVFLSQGKHKVHLLVRSNELRSTMSRYLIQRLTQNPQIELHFHTEVIALEGNDHLEWITWRDKQSGEVSRHPIQHLFIMAGASPRTEWLRGCVALDEKGFILTGRDLAGREALGMEPAHSSRYTPQMLETSLPGVFAVGDVRAGNVKRVASAVGEGAIAISMVHRALAEL